MNAAAHAAVGLALVCVLTAATVPRGFAEEGERGPSEEVAFNHPAGFCDAPFLLRLAGVPPGAAIYFTTNGAAPRPDTAVRYSQPIPIATTTVVRAATFDSATNARRVTTRTYLFADDVLDQTGLSLPKTWGTNEGWPVPAYYRMSLGTGDTNTSRRAVAEALRALPTLCLVADPADLFSDRTGIYTHPLERGAAWERPVSVEMFDVGGKTLFRCGAGLRIHGGTSRDPAQSPKHSFRLAFKPRYGPASLRYPLFGPEGAQEFDALVLRAGNNNSWLDSNGEGRRRADYIRDEWMRRNLAAMGHPSARGIFVHLYLNGLYWGIYNLCERPGPALFGVGLPGPMPEFDARNADKIESGDAIAWDKMMAVANAGLGDAARYEHLARMVDLSELADYLILNSYAGNQDWDRSANWYAARPRVPGGRFRFFIWDAERTLEDPEADMLDADDDDSPLRLFHALAENSEFRKLFAARVQQLLFGRGPLAPEIAAQRYRTLADSVAAAMTAEAARWGAYRLEVHPFKTGPYERCTVESHWRPEVERILNQYFPERGKIVVEQFRERGLFPPAGASSGD